MMLRTKNGKTTVRVKQISENLKRRATDKHLYFLTISEKIQRKKNSQKRRTTLSKNLKNWKKVQGAIKQKPVSYIKQAVINLTNTQLIEEKNWLLNIGPNFVPATKKLPVMDIILVRETCAIDLERNICAKPTSESMSHS